MNEEMIENAERTQSARAAGPRAGGKKKPEPLNVYIVRHPQYGGIFVNSISAELASVEAAGRWGVAWGKVAALCEVELVGKFFRMVCSSCRKEFAGEKDAHFCPVCEERRKMAAQEKAERQNNYSVNKAIRLRQWADRRAGKRK